MTSLSPESAEMIFKTLFLRVHTRRQLKGALPTLAHGQTTLGVLILQIQQLLMLSRSPAHMATTLSAWEKAQPASTRGEGKRL